MSLSVCVFLVAFKAQPFCCWMECRFRDISTIWMVPLTASTTLDISSVVVRQSACAVNRYIFAYHRMNKLNCIISWWELGHPWRLQAINKVLAHGSLVISLGGGVTTMAKSGGKGYSKECTVIVVKIKHWNRLIWICLLLKCEILKQWSVWQYSSN